MCLGCVCADESELYFFKQMTAYEMRISDWSSDVCSSDLSRARARRRSERDAAGALHRPEGSVHRPLRRHHPRLCRRHLVSRRSARDRKSDVQGKSVSERVDLGGHRIFKKTDTTRDIETSKPLRETCH